MYRKIVLNPGDVTEDHYNSKSRSTTSQHLYRLSCWFVQILDEMTTKYQTLEKKYYYSWVHSQ